MLTNVSIGSDRGSWKSSPDITSSEDSSASRHILYGSENAILQSLLEMCQQLDSFNLSVASDRVTHPSHITNSESRVEFHKLHKTQLYSTSFNPLNPWFQSWEKAPQIPSLEIGQRSCELLIALLLTSFLDSAHTSISYFMFCSRFVCLFKSMSHFCPFRIFTDLFAGLFDRHNGFKGPIGVSFQRTGKLQGRIR
jgi:hypothetical protein